MKYLNISLEGILAQGIFILGISIFPWIIIEIKLVLKLGEDQLAV